MSEQIEEVRIGSLSAEEMIKRARENLSEDSGLPRQDETHNSKYGWRRLLGISHCYTFEILLQQLIDDGLAKRVRGLLPCGNHWRKGELIESDWLAKEAKKKNSLQDE